MDPYQQSWTLFFFHQIKPVIFNLIIKRCHLNVWVAVPKAFRLAQYKFQFIADFEQGGKVDKMFLSLLLVPSGIVNQPLNELILTRKQVDHSTMVVSQ